MIEHFSFNTTQGGSVELSNTTVEEIKETLSVKFPTWSDEVIDKIANNQGFYKKLIPLNKEVEKKKNKTAITKTSILINGYELNPILKLGHSMHCFGKNGYRVWGKVLDNVFNDYNMSRTYNDFERSYKKVANTIRKTPISKQTITKNIIEMCDKMEDFKKSVEISGVINRDAHEEYVTNTGRRLGLKELIKRVGELSGECTEALS